MLFLKGFRILRIGGFGADYVNRDSRVSPILLFMWAGSVGCPQKCLDFLR